MSRVTAFHAGKRIAHGQRDQVASTLADRLTRDDGTVLVFEDETGRITDLDYRNMARGPGRPRLGVRGREVTLLPRHWEWLSRQPGGASAALRRLVEDARRSEPGERERKDRAYRFMQAACGDLPQYEEALRALYADRPQAFSETIASWPPDIGDYIGQLVSGTGDERDSADADR